MSKPKHNHRWNRCIIDEDYCLSFGHGEQFFRAFDRVFNLQPIIVQEKKPSGSIPQPIKDNVVGRVFLAKRNDCGSAGFFHTNHASAPIFNESHTHPRCALAHPLWDDVKSYPVINGKDDSNAWQPKMGSSPIHSLSAGAKSMKVVNRNTLEPETTLQIPADSNEEPGVQFCSHTSLLFHTIITVMQPPRFRSGELHYMRMRTARLAFCSQLL